MDFIDVSGWNGTFDWEHAKSQGIDGVYMKASQAKFVDWKFKQNSGTCILPYKGSYQYFDYRGSSGADQCKFFLDTVGTWNNLRGCLDIEDNSTNGWPKLNAVIGVALREALAWVTQYKLETGVYPVLYMSSDPTTWKQLTSTGYKYTFRNFTQCPLWVANYNKITSPPVGAWEDYAMWQFTATGDGRAYGNDVGNVYIDINHVKSLDALLLPGITIEDPVVVTPVPVVLTLEQRIKRLELMHGLT